MKFNDLGRGPMAAVLDAEFCMGFTGGSFGGWTDSRCCTGTAQETVKVFEVIAFSDMWACFSRQFHETKKLLYIQTTVGT